MSRVSPQHTQRCLRSDDVPPRLRVLQAAGQISALLDQTRGEAVQDTDTLTRYNDIAERLAAAPSNQRLRHMAIAEIDDGKLNGAQMRFLNDLLTANERSGIPADVALSITNNFLAGQFADAVDEITPQTVFAMSVAQRVEMASALQADVGGDSTYVAREQARDRGLAALVNYSTPGDAAIVLNHIRGKPTDTTAPMRPLPAKPWRCRRLSSATKLSADSLYAATSIEAGLHLGGSRYGARRVRVGAAGTPRRARATKTSSRKACRCTPSWMNAIANGLALIAHTSTSDRGAHVRKSGTDPVWSDRVSPFTFAGPMRHAMPCVALADPPRIDAIFGQP